MAKTTKTTTSRTAKTPTARAKRTKSSGNGSEPDAREKQSRAKAGATSAKSETATAAPMRKRPKKSPSPKTATHDALTAAADPKPDAPASVEPDKPRPGTATAAAKTETSEDGDKAPAARPKARARARKQAPRTAKKPATITSAEPTPNARSRTQTRTTASAGTASKTARSRQPRKGLPDPGFTSPYRRRLRQLHEVLWRGDGAKCERLPTHGVVRLDDLTIPKARLAEAYPDRSSPARLVDWTIDALPMRPQRLTFIDLGSGRGRVLMEAAKYPFREVIGVEITRELHETALMNLRHWPRWRLACRNVTLVNCDVGQFDMPKRNIVLYLFRPFTDRLMTTVARKATAVARAGHHVFVIVVDPKHALPFNESPIFEALPPSPSVRRRLRWRSPYSVAFFRVDLP